MIQTIKQQVFRGWHFMRWLRLAAGLFIGVQAFFVKDALIGSFGAFFVFQAVSGTGCCGANGCALPLDHKTTDSQEKSPEAKK